MLDLILSAFGWPIWPLKSGSGRSPQMLHNITITLMPPFHRLVFCKELTIEVHWLWRGRMGASFFPFKIWIFLWIFLVCSCIWFWEVQLAKKDLVLDTPHSNPFKIWYLHIFRSICESGLTIDQPSHCLAGWESTSHWQPSSIWGQGSGPSSYRPSL